MPKSARVSAVAILVASLGWVFLITVHYLWIPLYRELWLFGWLVVAFGWAWACVWSFTAVTAFFAVHSYGRAAAALVACVVVGAFVWLTDWRTAFVDNTMRLHRGAFADLAAAHREGRPLDVPWWISYVSIDGEVQDQGDVLYLPVFVDEWRAETGAGIARVPGATDRLVQTAEGDLGRPVRDLGGGWWWVE